MVEQLKKFTNPDSLVSLFLGLAGVIDIGVLIVNYVKGRQSPQSQAQTTGAQNEQGATGSTGVLPATHTVAAGESLWSIATDTIGSGYNWIDIAKANNLTNPDVITEGQQLTIPSVAKREPGQISAASVTVHRPADGKYKGVVFGPLAARYIRLEADAVNGTGGAQATEVVVGARR